jgi:hypothetical protein
MEVQEMQQSSRYETILGRLGAYLACQEARRVEIADEGAYLTVSWLSQGATRRQSCFREEEIARLQPSGRRDPNDSASKAALLGLLGRRLDDSGMDVARIEEKTDSFQISGATCGRYSSQRVGYWELRSQPAPTPRPEPVAEEPFIPPPVPTAQPVAWAAALQPAPEPAKVQIAPAAEPIPTASPEPVAKGGPATEIISRELRPLPQSPLAAPLRRRLQG